MNKYFRKVPKEKLEQFMRFRQEHSLKQAEIDGVGWEYLTAGDPTARPVLILPGALSTAESAWRMIILLEEEKFHLICPSYPAQIDTMGALADGVAGILSREGMETAYVVGGAYGSMLAQVFTHRHPVLVTKLVLTHAYPPVGKRAKGVSTTLRLFRVAPMVLVRRILRLQMTGTLPPNPSPELLIIAGQIQETLNNKLTRQGALNIFLRMADFDQQAFLPADLAGWQGKTLLIFEEADPTTPEALRNELKENYPGAEVHMVSSNSRAKAILESGEYIQVLKEFLAQAD
ncbi:MAG TPA: alpha/beta hydrolase [Anaerolineales bacterium]